MRARKGEANVVPISRHGLKRVIGRQLRGWPADSLHRRGVRTSRQIAFCFIAGVTRTRERNHRINAKCQRTLLSHPTVSRAPVSRSAWRDEQMKPHHPTICTAQIGPLRYGNLCRSKPSILEINGSDANAYTNKFFGCQQRSATRHALSRTKLSNNRKAFAFRTDFCGWSRTWVDWLVVGPAGLEPATRPL